MKPQREIRNALVTLLRLPQDHTGNYTDPFALSTGIDTTELDGADNDFAEGLVVQTIVNTPYKDVTLIVVIEDDAHDGVDRVDTHRSVDFIVGPYVKQGALVSTTYNAACLRRLSCQCIAMSANPQRRFNKVAGERPRKRVPEWARLC